ncbi:MAG: cysteine desulfurase family protein [Planctomycetota bacterium]
MDLPIYLDHNATTPLDSRVLEKMIPFFSHYFGNASSRTHSYGWIAEKAVKEAREQVALALQCEPGEILFTSGATESNNLAIFGVLQKYKKYGNHFVTVKTEHPSVLDPFKALENQGFEGTYLSVDQKGQISLNELEKAFSKQTILVSVMAANNETGVLHPINEIGDLCREHKILFHCDATQAVGKIPIQVRTMKIDLLSFSAHKFYGPKGVGGLFYSRKTPRVQVFPLFWGGGQEDGLRSGTLNVPGIVGLGEAIYLAKEELETAQIRLKTLKKQLYEGLCSELNGLHLNGSSDKTLPGTLNLSFSGIRSQNLAGALKKIAVSSGSACASASLEPSYVLKAMGRSDESARASLRFSLGRSTTSTEIVQAIHEVVETVKRLQNEYVF